jgi:hypothetical protein
MLKQYLTSKHGKKMAQRFSVILASLLLALPLTVIGGSPAPSTAAAATAVDGVDYKYIDDCKDCKYIDWYTYIFYSNPQQFGDQPDYFGFGTYRGTDYNYNFNAHGVNPNYPGFLTVRARGVTFPFNFIQVNGVPIPRALPPHKDDEWHTTEVPVPPGVLRSINNVVHIGARSQSGQLINSDNFVIDYVKFTYKRQCN